MSTPSSPGQAPSLSFSGVDVDREVVVVGAGFSGVRTLIETRSRGLSTVVVEAGPDIGGTWYWNRYPGARTDSQAWVYGFPLAGVRDDWRWEERFATQPQTYGYIRHVADVYDLWPDIRLNTRVESAVYDEDDRIWRVRTDDGTETTCRFLVTATGQLSLPYFPDFPGLADFAGEWYRTSKWPEEGVDLTGKRVAVVGTGATAVQVIPIVAQDAAHLTVFQRTPNYVLPARNDALSEHDVDVIRKNFDEIFDRAFAQPFGMDMSASAGRVAADCTPQEQQQILDRGWEAGGFRYLFETFDDILTDEAANELASEFIRAKIRSIVRDPRTAELLCPKDYPLAAKRPPLGHYYYETFNRDNVDLVDLTGHELTIEPAGIRVGDTLHEVDVIVFATGYDAITGTLDRIEIRGRGGALLRDRWTEGPRTYLGMLVDGFPNLFMVAGPQSPFANIPVVSEVCVRWLSELLTAMHERGAVTAEPSSAAVDRFSRLTEEVIDATVLRRGGKTSWYLGTNIPGKPAAAVMWLGGVGSFRDLCDAESGAGYPEITFDTRDRQPIASAPDR
ncbi:NAD(P)/FAD-dependent oxidoreductase [Pseudonocardia kongjuensis]|uniref:NAD(P)/FAD-dependent oxidoreductase n=1 Tax=Pseudonocardia kongjuensis TaxID=102227 RepID=A0ABN1XMS1_9PSEU